MKILVTGASGFVGSAVARYLLAQDIAVRVMLRGGSDPRNIEDLDLECVYGDLLNKESLAAAVGGCDAVFHVAADYRLWVRDPAVLYRANVDGTVNLMRAAQTAKVKRIVYTSSVATLGLHADHSPADEDTPVSLKDMIGHYKRSKYLAEQEVINLVNKEDLPAVIVNPSAPVGPRDIKPTPTGAIIVDAVNGKMPAYVDTGLNIVHVDDVAAGHWLAFQHGKIGEKYILASENLTLKQILYLIADITHGKAPKFKMPYKLAMLIAYCNEYAIRIIGRGEPKVSIDSVKMAKKHMFFTSAKAESQLGFKPRPAIDAFVDAIDWFKNNGYCR